MTLAEIARAIVNHDKHIDITGKPMPDIWQRQENWRWIVAECERVLEPKRGK